MTRKKILAIAIPAAMIAVAGVVVAQSWETTLGVGTDLAAEAKCLSCHVTVKDQWDLPSTHKLIYDCKECHTTSAPSGKGHADKKACADCHSEKTHPGTDASCLSCHDIHGAANTFLIKPTLGGKPVLLSKPEGKSANGLAHGTGDGVCEVCHAGKKYYNGDGTGAAHEEGWCIKCHSHQNGFEPGPVE